MALTNKLRVATIDTPHAIDITCSAVEGAVGLPVRADIQEVEGVDLIIELQLGHQSVHTHHVSRLVSAVDRTVSDVEVLSSWRERTSPEPAPQDCSDVIGVGYDPIPELAQRALHDDLPTAKWDRSERSWHIAVPSVCRGQAIVGMSHRRGYDHRFTAHDAAALGCGLRRRNGADNC